jgi:hypothetical protein
MDKQRDCSVDRMAPSSSRLRLPTRRRRFGFALHARRSSRICKDDPNSIHALTFNSSRGKIRSGRLVTRRQKAIPSLEMN